MYSTRPGESGSSVSSKPADILREDIEAELGAEEEDMDPTQAQTISMRRAQWRQRLAEGRKKQATDESRAKLMALGVEPEGVMRISTIKVKAGQLAEIVYQFRENIVPSYTDTG
eukprot:TRINITY_DN46522_c0_g1_i5.p1 TRINITY_DN46522_c0_g1~~TRINITY_DN46522_c0_g1_i5.p1  ORF type:complete len:114 (+),score=16.30 TRINITY_DN46522_c0_g1_i5:110-451(+)